MRTRTQNGRFLKSNNRKNPASAAKFAAYKKARNAETKVRPANPAPNMEAT